MVDHKEIYINLVFLKYGDSSVLYFENLDSQMFLCPFPYSFSPREGPGCHFHSPGYKSRKLGSRRVSKADPGEGEGFGKNPVMGLDLFYPVPFMELEKDY